VSIATSITILPIRLVPILALVSIPALARILLLGQVPALVPILLPAWTLALAWILVLAWILLPALLLGRASILRTQKIRGWEPNSEEVFRGERSVPESCSPVVLALAA
jgi:hypothetical protein